MEINIQEKLKIIGKNIKNCRRAKGLNQESLAKMTGITSTYLSNIETGKSNPCLQLVIDLAEKLETPLKDIVTSPDELEKEKQLSQAIFLLESILKDLKQKE